MDGGYKFGDCSFMNEVRDILSGVLEEIRQVWQNIKPDEGGEIQVNFSRTAERFRTELQQVEELCEGRGGLMENSHCRRQLENVRDSISELNRLLKEGQYIYGKQLAEFQLYPFVQELLEDIYFYGCVYPDHDKMKEYYKSEFSTHHANIYLEEGRTKYDVSIFIPAFNKLDYTKQCVESVLQYSDVPGVEKEIILVDHGSDDETEAYFQTIRASRPNVKVIRFKHNVRMLMFSAVFRACEGRYAAFVSNDTIVTVNWLKNLYACVKSDPLIISATPVALNMSNYQSIMVDFNNMDDMHDFAKQYNRLEPKNWHQRSRIMPVIALYDVEQVNRIGFIDRYFKTMEFWDDDFSIRARRAGCRQMLCGDVFCYHFGSVTGKEAQITENTVGEGRRLFYDKHEIDPWSSGAYYDLNAISFFAANPFPVESRAAILGIDCGFGDTPLQIKNMLRTAQIDGEIFNISSARDFDQDLKNLSEVFIPFESKNGMSSALEKIKTQFKDRKFYYIYVNKPFANYLDWERAAGLLYGLLEKGGALVMKLENNLKISEVYGVLKALFTRVSAIPVQDEIDPGSLYIQFQCLR